MPVLRTYQCETCDFQWTHTHPRSDDPFPPCPNCQANDPAWRPQSIRIKGNKAKAIDITQKIVEEEFGLTNMRDNTRAGETAAMAPRADTTTEREAKIRSNAEVARALAETAAGRVDPGIQAAVKAFNGDTSGIAAMAPQAAAAAANPGQMIAMAKQATAEARAMNSGSPMELLHRGLKSGKHDITRSNIIARAPLGT